MAVRHEIKSQLAKLLATEDLIVEHKRVETAQFDVHTRILTLPTWDRASNVVYDMLVGHEVGHALYTPDEWGWRNKIPQQFVNVVEDARIEKLMKRRYPGLAKTFYNAYNELSDSDFFELNDQDIDDLNLADRVNLYYKIGSFVDVCFSTIEKQIVTMIGKCETFEDTKKAALVLYEFCKADQDNKESEQVNISPDNVGENELDLDGELGDNTNEEPQDNNSKESNASAGCEGAEGQSNIEDDGLEVKTAESLSESLKDLVNTSDLTSNVYFELPKLDLKNIIIPNKFIHETIKLSFQVQQVEWDQSEYSGSSSSLSLYDEVDQEYIKFKRGAQKEVNYLVKEFECKKSASAYARSTTARTGILDTAKLHTYKFNEDLFKKVNIVPDGKNHGLVFVLDWSGSMGPVILDTIKQLYNLLWFCKKVNIPFEVYAFTNEFPASDGMHRLAYEKEEGLAFVEETFSLMNLFTSKVKKNDLDSQMNNIFRIAAAFSRNFYCPYNIPIGMNLSGTPLNESLIALHQIIPEFKDRNKLEKVQCVILTDGEGSPLRYSKKFQRDWESDGYMGSSYIHDHCILRNRKTGHTYSCSGLGRWADVTDLMLHDLRETFPNTNFIGIRVMTSRDAGQFIRRYVGYEDESYHKTMTSWKKNKSFVIRNSGYHSYFGLSSSALGNDDEFDVDDDASKAQIKRAFAKSLKSKKMNKKILGEFIELVA